ncbi:MAG: TIGR02302 family protein, partial [Parvibaculaceae bacterium]
QLVLRVTGANEPKVAFFGFDGGSDTGAELANPSVRTRTENGAFSAEAKFDRPMRVVVSDDSGTLAEWRIAVLPDQPPKIAFQGEPQREATGALRLGWKASDDYGVSGVSATIALSDTQEDGFGIAADGVFMFDPPQFPISLKRAAPREIADTSANDLTAHPWAGFNVDIVLEARDQAGRTGQSETKTVKLPEREFFKPLARALIEQRKALILNPTDRKDVVAMLDALLAWPDGLIDRSGIQIAISAVRSHIATARDQDDVRESVDDLWKIALLIEEGDMADLKAQLEALQKELRQALAEGAPPERIAELMDKLRETMNKYMQQMAEETRRQMQQGKLQPQQMQPGQTITPEDLQKMLDMIQKLAESGANEAAQEMLSQLESLLRNLQPGMAGEMPPQGDTPMSQMLGDLSELMRRQQQLMDETMRMPGEGDQMQQGEGDQQGQQGQGQQGRSGRPGDKLAGEQDALGKMLEELMNGLGQQGMNAPPSFGDAQKSMKGASGSLRQGNRDPALGQQSDALNALREGAQNMARQMMQQGQGQQGNYGRHGEARGDDRDPLGRPRANRGEDFGPERNMLPSEMAVRRAQEILEMLRSRAGMPDLPRIDRDYIDRLLRGLY